MLGGKLMAQIQIKRGLKANLPALADGEFAYCTDTKELFLGTMAGNVLIAVGSVPIQAPNDVTNLAVSSITSSALTLSWTASTGATSYDVYQGSTLIGNTASTTYNVTGLTQATSYTFKVIAKNAGGPASGVTVSAATIVAADTTPPNDVTNLTVSNNITGTSLTLNWTASDSSDIASYDIYQGLTFLANVTGTTYAVSGLTVGTQYTFSVRAKDTSGNVATGTTVTATTVDTTSPSNVTGLNYSNLSTTSVNLTWTASASNDVTGYDIYNGATLVTNTASTSYTVTGLTQNTNYTFTVKAKDTSGNAASGSSINLTTVAATGTQVSLTTFNKIVIVMMENRAESTIIGDTTDAPYINSLATNYANFTNYKAIEHPSQPNYLDVFSGSNQGSTNDNYITSNSINSPNLYTALNVVGKTFGGYSEDLPSVGSTVDTANGASGYASKHNPWSKFSNVPTTVNMPFVGYFPTDYNQLPDISMVVPNLLDDMHDGTIAQGDTWIQTKFDSYLQWALNNNSLLILWFDEDEDAGGTNTVPFVIAGANVKKGTYTGAFNHYGLLKTLIQMKGGSSFPNNSASATTIDNWYDTTKYVATLGDSGSPANVTGLSTSSITSSGATLSWTSSTSADVINYVIYNGVTQLGSVSGTTTSYNVTGLSSSTQYTLTVKTKDSSGNFSSGANIVFTTSAPADTTPPNDVTNLTTSNITSTGVTLTWTASNSSDIKDYQIYNGVALLSTVTATTYNVTGLSASTNYTLTVKSRDTSNNVSAGTNITFTTSVPVDTTPPNDVTNLSVSNNNTGTSLTLTWTASTSSDIGTYDVYNGATLLGNTSNTTYGVTGLTRGTSYTFYIKAKDTSGNEAAGTSITVTATDTTAPNNVTGLSTSNITQTSLTLSWTASTSPDIASYDVYNGATLLGNTASTTYNVTGLTNGTAYTFTIKAKDQTGNVASGTSTSATTVATNTNIITSDSFNSADNTNVNGRATDCAYGGAPKTWAFQGTTGTYGIISNTLYASTQATTGHNWLSVDVGVSDYWIQITFASTGGQESGKIVLRGTDGENFIALTIQGSNGLYLYGYNAGVDVGDVTVGSAIINNGDVVKAHVYGTSVQVFVNGTSWGTYSTSWSSVPTTATKCGLNAYHYPDIRFDDFVVSSADFTITHV